MTLFDDWCDQVKEESDVKALTFLSEKPGGRSIIKSRLGETIRSHYEKLETIAEDINQLGYPLATALLKGRLPQTVKARSGDLGEILATEHTEEKLGYTVPVRRLRYKDGREMALRGDDFIGILLQDEKLYLLKGESKSRLNLSKSTIEEARTVLNRDNGRCTPHSLAFIANLMIEKGGDEGVIGRQLRNEVALAKFTKNRIGHALFTLSGNAPFDVLRNDLTEAEADRLHHVVHFQIEDHQEFLEEIFTEAANIGND